jgi:hypothetical protein
MYDHGLKVYFVGVYAVTGVEVEPLTGIEAD